MILRSDDWKSDNLERSPLDSGFLDWSERETDRDREEREWEKVGNDSKPTAGPDVWGELRRSRLWMRITIGWRDWFRALCPKCDSKEGVADFVYLGENDFEAGGWEFPNGAPDVATDYGKQLQRRNGWILKSLSVVDARLDAGERVELLCRCRCGNAWISKPGKPTE